MKTKDQIIIKEIKEVVWLSVLAFLVFGAALCFGITSLIHSPDSSYAIPICMTLYVIYVFIRSNIQSIKKIRNMLRVDEYTKQQAIEFVAFRELYHREQRRKVKEEEERLGGMITWDYTPDDQIYNKFIQKQGK
jgi:hypothetical protein